MWIPFYWLYLWQLKEYRLDRLLSHLRLHNRYQIIRMLLWGERRRPQLTVKLEAIAFVAMAISLIGISLIGWLVQWQVSWWLLGIGFVWLLSPLSISLSLLGIVLFEWPVRRRLYRQAQRKASILLSKSLIIGVTGSYGKTTTKEFLGTILSTRKETVITPKHVNQTLPMALFIKQKLITHPEVFVMEYASYGLGNIAFDTKHILAPRWAVLTGIAPQHLELFGSMENIVTAKLELAQSVPHDGKVFYNQTDPYLAQAIERITHAECIPFSVTDAEKYLAQLSWRNTLKGALLADLFGSNVAAAVKVAQTLGLSEKEVFDGMEQLNWLPKTLQPIEKPNVTIIDDSYSSNEVGFHRLIEFVKTQDFSKKILVTGGVIELGAESEKINRQLAQAAHQVFDVCYITNPILASAWDSAAEVPFSQLGWQSTVNRLKTTLEPKTLVVIEGRIPVDLYDAILGLEAIQ